MTANECSPDEGKNAPESIDTERYAAIGKHLLRFHLEDTAGDLHSAFNVAAGKVAQGREVTAVDVRRLYDSLDAAEETADYFAELVPDAPARRDVVDVMTQEEVQEFFARFDDLEELDATVNELSRQEGSGEQEE